MRDFISKILGNKKEAEKTNQQDQGDDQLTVVQESIDSSAKAIASDNGKQHMQNESIATTMSDTPTITEDDSLTEIEEERSAMRDDPPVEADPLTETAETEAEAIPSRSSRIPGLRAAQSCHIGNVRSRNEDSSFIFTAESGGQEPLMPFGLYIVADGMGGHHAGHEASKSVTRLVAQHVLERIYIPLLRSSTEDNANAQEPVSEVILDAVQVANQQIHSPDPGKDSGTTLTAALVFGRRLYVAHVGDSRAYLMTDGELRQVTVDHSYVRRLQEAGQITEDEAAVHPQRNMLYRAVGQGGTLEIDTFTRSLPRSGKIFLCSDGLWGLVPNSVIRQVIQQDQPLNMMTEELVSLALEAGGHDNITGILVDFSF